MHLKDGELHAYLDNELDTADRVRIDDHLANCANCQEQAKTISDRSYSVRSRITSLAPSATTSPLPSTTAYHRLQERILEKENQSMLNKLFSRQYRLAWATLGVIAILGIAFAFPGVRAIANSFLGLFRVEQFSVVQVNPGDLPEQLGSSSQFEYMLSNNVQVEELGEPQDVSSVEEASDLVGIPVRLPTEIESTPQLKVQPGAQVSFEIDLPLVKAVLDEIGQDDLELPANLDGAIVEMELPTSVTASYGDCQFDPQAAREAGYDPDDPEPLLQDCITLAQMLSPTISAPPGLDIVKIGEAFLQVLGMSPEEAAQFSQTVDWTTTLVIPIPRYGTDYKDVTVDGVNGTLIQQKFQDHADQYLLLWVKNEILYALTGQGTEAKAIAIANSIE